MALIIDWDIKHQNQFHLFLWCVWLGFVLNNRSLMNLIKIYHKNISKCLFIQFINLAYQNGFLSHKEIAEMS